MFLSSCTLISIFMCLQMSLNLYISILSFSEVFFQWVWAGCFILQWLMGYLGLALVFVWGGFSAGVGGGGGGHGRSAIVLWGLDTFLIFPNFLGSYVLGHSATREATLIYHVYK